MNNLTIEVEDNVYEVNIPTAIFIIFVWSVVCFVAGMILIIAQITR